jgi:hypothetical protein
MTGRSDGSSAPPAAYHVIEIQAGNHTITATGLLPDDLRTAGAAITQGAH